MSSGFVTESEALEARKKRQEEWEKVRQPDQPLERPEEPYDARSLFERLKEQRDKKDLEFEESHKLKNLIRGLDDDEVNFLDIVDKAKMDAEKRQQIEENNELLEFRQRVASLQEKSIDQKISTETAVAKPKPKQTSSRPSQKSILAGLVVRKRPNDSIDSTTNGKTSSDSIPNKISKIETSPKEESSMKEAPKPTANASTESKTQSVDLSAYDKGALKCIGILPGIGKYRESSDSEKSTDTDDEYDFSEFDWMGNKMSKDKGDGCHE